MKRQLLLVHLLQSKLSSRTSSNCIITRKLDNCCSTTKLSRPGRCRTADINRLENGSHNASANKIMAVVFVKQQSYASNLKKIKIILLKKNLF